MTQSIFEKYFFKTIFTDNEKLHYYPKAAAELALLLHLLYDDDFN
jgi:hypothetical protein